MDNMMISRQGNVLDQVVQCLAEIYSPERIYLFGSKAHGDANYDSDYDLLVIVPDDIPRERRRSGPAYEALWDSGLALDILIWTKSYFESRLHLKASLSATVVREVKLLYAA